MPYLRSFRIWQRMLDNNEQRAISQGYLFSKVKEQNEAKQVERTPFLSFLPVKKVVSDYKW
tara:strand:- start:656 stop:838 length:183 start_codon:yes stop_codon:yes gene_type:complete